MPTAYSADRGDWDGSDTPPSEKSKKQTAKDAEMLLQIRQTYDYYYDAWKDTRDQAEKDDRTLSISGPWADEERAARKRHKRPTIHLDQISQYVHALINEVRSNPISIDIDPSGEGANEDTAELRSNRVRQIEYESNGVQAYQTALESAAKRGMGFAGIKIDYKSWDSTQRIIKIRRFPNSYAILPDPDPQEADFSDMEGCFVLSRMTHDAFKRKFKNRDIGDFGSEHIQLAPKWVNDDSVQVAEYWYKEYRPRTQIVFTDESGGDIIRYLDEFKGAKVDKKRLILKDGTDFEMPVKSVRKVHQPIVMMCLTNGLEILEQENGEKYVEWPGKWIPVGVCLGEEDFVRSGEKVKRDVKSLIRRARDGQMLFDYYKSCEAEAVGMAPKVQWVIYEGQDDGHETEWKKANKVPLSVLHVKATTDEVPNQILSLPKPAVYEPPVQAVEIGSESARRSIQASMGSYGFTRLDDTNVKSGIALDRLKAQNQLSSFHFVDNYKHFIRHMGRMINDLLDDVEGSRPMTVGTRDRTGKYEAVKINQNVNGKVRTYSLTDESQHEVTISTGPNFQTQREEAVMLVDTLVQNLDKLPIDPPTKSKIMALLIKLKQLGPIGEQLEKTFAPDPGDIDPMQVMAEYERMAQVAEALGQKVQQLENELKYKASIKEADNQTRRDIAALNADVEKLRIMVEAMGKTNELESKETIAATEQDVKREMKEIDRDIAKMGNSGSGEKNT